jgi:hypothetical protein
MAALWPPESAGGRGEERHEQRRFLDTVKDMTGAEGFSKDAG